MRRATLRFVLSGEAVLPYAGFEARTLRAGSIQNVSAFCGYGGQRGNMWLVKRNDPVPGSQATALTPTASDALRRAYQGSGTHQQVKDAIDLVKQARMLNLWFACDCQTDNQNFPLLTPAYLTEFKRYYLRRMTGPDRPEHAEDCAFRFDRPEPGLESFAKVATSEVSLRKPNGFFSVLKHEEAEGIAGSADADITGERDRKTPALARQLWRLIDDTGLNRLGPVQSSGSPSIGAQFKKIRQSAETISVNNGVTLSSVLSTFPDDYHNKRLFARIRQAKKLAPDPNVVLQGFALLYTPLIDDRSLIFDKSEPIMIAGELHRPVVGDSDRRAPYLSLVVIGDHKMASGLAALRGYAQPVYSGSQFVPVDSDFERQVLVAINRVRWRLSRDRPDLHISVHKPLFAVDGGAGGCLPDFILTVENTIDGVTAEIVIEAMGYDNSDYYEAKARTHPRMEAIGPIMSVTPSELGNKSALDQTMIASILASVG